MKIKFILIYFNFYFPPSPPHKPRLRFFNLSSKCVRLARQLITRFTRTEIVFNNEEIGSHNGKVAGEYHKSEVSAKLHFSSLAYSLHKTTPF